MSTASGARSFGGGLPGATRAKAAAKMRGYQDAFLEAVATGLEASAGQLVELLERERALAQ